MRTSSSKNGKRVLMGHGRPGLAGRSVAVTGGLGFIGSNLAIELVRAGCRVTVLDGEVEGTGANLFNLSPVCDQVRFLHGDLAKANGLAESLRGVEVVCHLAAVCDHEADAGTGSHLLQANVTATASLLEAIKVAGSSPIVIMASTRGVYGRPARLPVSESATTQPRTAYECSKLACEQLAKQAAQETGFPLVVLRLSNVFGPRAQVRHGRHGVANWLIRRALADEDIPLYEGGHFLRDFLYVDDCVSAIVACMARPRNTCSVLNIGGNDPMTLRAFAASLIKTVGRGRLVTVPYTEQRRKAEVGDYASDLRAAKGALGWTPRWPLERALSETVAFYSKHMSHYA